MKIGVLCVCVGLLLGCDPGLQAQQSIVPAYPALRFNKPVDVQHAGDGSHRLFVVEQSGVIQVFDDAPETSSMSEFLNIQSQVRDGGERGLLGLAFHPDFATNGHFFVNYTTGSSLTTRISRFTVSANDPNQADPNSELLFLQFQQPFGNHNGGGVAFGPDGYLYIGTGDGGSGGDPENNGQDLTTWLGKMLRIDVDQPNVDIPYSIPPDNPFVSRQDGTLPEIYAYGLRNPWRYAFDEATGRLWVGDVGQGSLEEIDVIEAGGNYGWRTLEGTRCFNPSNNCNTAASIPPVFEYGRSEGQSITGGRVYRGDAVPSLVGHYIYADYVSGKVWSLDPADLDAPVVTEIEDTNLAISSFGVDEAGELLIVDHRGSLHRIDNNPVETGSASEAVLPALGVIEQAYPNPFTRAATIDYSLPQPGRVQMHVFDVTGRLVRLLINHWQPAGRHAVRWDGLGRIGQALPAGLFFLQLQVDGRHQQTQGLLKAG